MTRSPRWIRHPWLAGLGVVACFGVAAQETPVFEAGARLVLADVSVVNANTGLPVRKLAAEDFVVYDGDVQVPVSVFDSGTLPLDVALLVDLSGGSGVRNYLNDIRTPVGEIFNQLEPDDEIGVVGFKGNVKVYSQLETKARAWPVAREAVLDQAITKSVAKLLPALTTAGGLFQGIRPPDRRRVVFVVSHNVEKPIPKTLTKAVAALERTEASVIGVLVPLIRRSYQGSHHRIGLPIPGPKQLPQTPVYSETEEPEGGALEAVLKSIHGELLRPDDVKLEIWEAFHRLRSTYLVGFYAPQRKGQHNIRVELTPAAQARLGAVEIRHRRGYTQ